MKMLTPRKQAEKPWKNGTGSTEPVVPKTSPQRNPIAAHRRYWLRCCLLPMAAALLLAVPVAAEPKPPNIVIFLADDLGWADLGFRGSPIETPALDRLAREGTELYRFYTTPICSPSRAALMTGRDPVRLGVVYSVILPWHNHGIHEDEHFMSQSFGAAGYQTAIIGKWHLGHSQQQFHPNRRGFDHFYGHLHTEVGYFPPFGNLGATDFQRNGVTVDDQGYETYLLAAEAERWIRSRDKSRPFFLYMPFIAPHPPLQAPAELIQKYRDLPDQRQPARSPADTAGNLARLTGRKSKRQLYAAVVDALDQAIGRVLKTLDEQGIADNTIVLFFSDNGGSVQYGRAGASNYPLRGSKLEAYEGGIRVPALIRWPGRVPAGRRLNQMMTVMDVFPTLAAASGVRAQNRRSFDGLNMWPAIADDQPVKRRQPVVFASETPIYGSYDFAVFHGDWKLVKQLEQDQESITVTNQLFHITKDPGEYHNLAERHPSRVQRLSRLLHRWRNLHPINGVRAMLAPPPGWHPPRDWADYPIPSSKLQAQPSIGIAAPELMRLLDFRHGERGRLLYDCEPLPVIGSGLCQPDAGQADVVPPSRQPTSTEPK